MTRLCAPALCWHFWHSCSSHSLLRCKDFFSCGWSLALAVVSVSVVLAGFAPHGNGAELTAEQILKDTGVQGGLIVHLGCGDGKLTAALRASEAYLVQGLDRDPQTVRRARQEVVTRDLYGPVTIEQLTGNRLPYADNLVNLLVVEKDVGGIAVDELMRVLTPQGVAYLQSQGSWDKWTKPRPADIDEWPHYLHGPDGNPVARDQQVGPPNQIRWMGLPKFSRGHEQQASFSSCVTAGGRLFYIVDEAPTVDVRMPAQWTLVARDAYNGVVLWKRPMGQWVDHLRRFRSGPASLQFRLVASPERVFVTFDFVGPLSILDAATGKTLRIVEGSEYTKQIIHQDGMLWLLTDDLVGQLAKVDAARRRGEFIPRECRILKVDSQTGRTLWERRSDDLVFPSITFKDRRVFAQTPKRVFALDDATGSEVWSAELAAELPVSRGKINTGEMQWEAPTLLVGDKAVYAADFKKIQAYAVADGKLLWQGPSVKGYNAPADLHLVGGLLWMDRAGKRVGLDPLTGQTKKQLPQRRGYMHARCYRNKATEGYFLLGQMGVQMLEIETGDIRENDWIRGTCQYGILPANGLLYVPPDCCACNMKTKLSGVYALASNPESFRPGSPSTALTRGPAFGQVQLGTPGPEDWATFRGNPARGGMSSSNLPLPLSATWRTDLGGRLSGVTAAQGRLYLAAIDRHTLYALNQSDGQVAWQFIAGGRIDSPPTILGELVCFGSADGHVYALRATDGQLVWKFRAAPSERKVFISGRLESAWPVHGSVLFHEDALVLTAGRSSYLDGGITLYKLKPETGEVLASKVIYSPTAEGKQPAGGGRDVFGVLDDVLLADGGDLYMRHAKVDFEQGASSQKGVHLFSPIGLLDDTWWHRAYWVMHDEFLSHWSGWWKVGNTVPSGRILAYNQQAIYGFGRDAYPGGNSGQWRGGERYHLFAYDRKQTQTSAKNTDPMPAQKKKRRGPKKKPALKYRWKQEIPVLGTSLVVTPENVFVAGPPDLIKPGPGRGDALLKLANADEAVAAWNGQKGGLLYVASVTDGSKQQQLKLPAPTVFDGMAVASGRLFLALKNGQVMCLSSP